MHKGLHYDRIEANNINRNGLERAFAEGWIAEQKKWNTLTILLDDVREIGHSGHPEPSVRDKQVAATVVQWLGSNVGRAFVEEIFKSCGYRIEKV